MKNILLLILYLQFPYLSNSQDFLTDYYDRAKKSWEAPITNEMESQANSTQDSLLRAITGKGYWENYKENEKKSALQKIEFYKNLFAIMNIEQEKIHEMVIVVENSVSNPMDLNYLGYLFFNSKTYFFRINLEENFPMQSNPYFDVTERNKLESRNIVYNLILKNGINELEKLARKEVEVEYKLPEYQIQIIYYNSEAAKTIREIYISSNLPQILKE